MTTLMGGPSLALAQQGAQDGTTYNQSQPDTTGQTTNNDDRGFNWMWLLPLLALPLLFLFKGDKKEEDRSQNRDNSLAGSKGGEANRNRGDN